MLSRDTLAATASQSYSGSSGPKHRSQTPAAIGAYSLSQTRQRRTSTAMLPPAIMRDLEFRRIHDLPPYVFATVDQLKRELRREGRDVIDLGFGNPDIPSPGVAVEKLAEAAARPVNHRYSASRGLPNLRAAICERYAAQFGVELDPDRNAVSTI